MTLKIDGHLPAEVSRWPAVARQLEKVGYDGLMTTETQHDPFMTLVVAAQNSERLSLVTGIAVAFARSPMSLAYTARDLQEVSGGRLLLGLGTQIKPHIERRFSMPWSEPVERMREYVAALRTIWQAWETGERLDFRGNFYRHTLMTPFFSPGPSRHGPPRVLLAAVGERMSELAGEVADGIILHPFTNERYVRQVSLPAIERGLKRAGRTRSEFQIVLSVFAAVDERSTAAARQQLAFYGSTPAYREVLEVHGWGEAQSELNRLSKRGAWAEMASLIDDAMLEAFAIRAPEAELAERVRRRYGDVADRLSFYAGFEPSGELIADLRRS